MSKVIIAIIVAIIAAAGAYVLLFGGTLPTTETLDSLSIDAGAESVATEAEAAVSDVADEISSADNLEVPGVDE